MLSSTEQEQTSTHAQEEEELENIMHHPFRSSGLKPSGLADTPEYEWLKAALTGSMLIVTEVLQHPGNKHKCTHTHKKSKYS